MTGTGRCAGGLLLISRNAWIGWFRAGPAFSRAKMVKTAPTAATPNAAVQRCFILGEAIGSGELRLGLRGRGRGRGTVAMRVDLALRALLSLDGLPLTLFLFSLLLRHRRSCVAQGHLPVHGRSR